MRCFSVGDRTYFIPKSIVRKFKITKATSKILYTQYAVLILNNLSNEIAWSDSEEILMTILEAYPGGNTILEQYREGK